MSDLSTLYQQLEVMAREQKTDITTLISQISDFGNARHLPDDYIHRLSSATHLFTNTQNRDKVLKSLYEYGEHILSCDMGLAMLYDDSAPIIQLFGIEQMHNNNHVHIVDAEQTFDFEYLYLITQKQDFRILDFATCERLNLSKWFLSAQSALVFPLVNYAGLLGIVMFVSETEDHYNDVHGKLLMPFIHLATGALHNIRLLATISQSADELAALYHATSVLFQASSLRDFAQQITEVAVRAFDYSDCGLMVVDEEQGEIVRIMRAGREAVVSSHRLAINGKGLVPKAVREGRMIYEPDVRQSLEYVSGDGRSLCELVIPLKTSKGIIGVLDFQSMQTYAFNERDQRIIVAFAERVAPALENVILYDQLRQHAEELEDRVKQRTLELQNTKEQLETIIKSSPDAIVLLDKHAIIKQANLSWLSMVRASMRDVVDKPFSMFLLEQDRKIFETAVQQTLHDLLENDISVEIPHGAGQTYIEVEISLAPIIDGQQSGVVCNIRDVTQHKQTERLLREALIKSEELSRLKTNFVTMASHEFRTPLTTILSSSDIVAHYFDKLTDDKIRGHMAKIQREVDYLNSLIDDILLIGSKGHDGFSPKYQYIDVSHVTDTIVARVRINDNNQHPIAVHYAQPNAMIVTDPKLLAYMLDHLLSNACKYSNPGLPISLSIEVDEDLQIAVQDNGIGIPEDDIDRLFDSFHRGGNVGNVRGTGMGLAIVREVLVALNGRIDIQSKLGAGTLIIVNIPISNEVIGITSE